ncbi:hypothetical protein [Pseudomonas sp. Au-Pse12]|uniref:hypothetical protein n=1 Tax=Pseudomonas sp. Au-Pse12 TaxID=2906459 RepID=UPI001E62C94B|nr:hypothetical protein [Pseudomonas sp. Au-Pse12]MCE4054221.1 hypothetical protein [Pseudomonas sp. Au-Pse12]
MNSALLLLNAIAIAVLVAFSVQPAENAAPSGPSVTHYPLRPTPQLAVMNTPLKPGEVTRVTQGKVAQQTAIVPIERWIF